MIYYYMSHITKVSGWMKKYAVDMLPHFSYDCRLSGHVKICGWYTTVPHMIVI